MYKKDKYRIEDALIPFLLEGALISHAKQYERHEKITSKYCQWIAPEYRKEVEHRKDLMRRLIRLHDYVINKNDMIHKDIIKIYMIITHLAAILDDNQQAELGTGTKRAARRISRIIRILCGYNRTKELEDEKEEEKRKARDEGWQLKDKSAAKQAKRAFELMQKEGYFI